MRRWKRWGGLGIVAAASFVLLMTVLPQFASGIGLGSLADRLTASSSCGSSGVSGSSGSGSASCCSSSGSGSVGSSGTCATGPGTVTGTVTLTGAPRGFSPAYIGAGACPYTGTIGIVCANPDYSLIYPSGGTYSLQLSPGTWVVAGFYEINPLGGAFTGPPKTVVVPSGSTTSLDLTVPYQKPASLRGRITVTNLPPGVTVTSSSVLLCPTFAPYTGSSISIACVQGGYGPSGYGPSTNGEFRITGLPPGPWLAYPQYCTLFGCQTNPLAVKAVTLFAGKTSSVRLVTPFLVPGTGLVTGTVTVSGAPPGFSDEIAVSACNGGGGSNCLVYPVGLLGGGDTYDLILPVGTWTVTGLYLVAPFYNAVVGPSSSVQVAGGATAVANLVVPYQTLGTATGTIAVTGKTPHADITAYTVRACPVSGGGVLPPYLTCVDEYSGVGGFSYGPSNPGVLGPAIAHASPSHAPAAGPRGTSRARSRFNVYQLTTLTPGSWVLYPGYQTPDSSYVDPVGTTVTVTAGGTTVHRLTVPYQKPTEGLFTGTVRVVGAPGFGAQVGVEACTAPPTPGSCPGEISTFGGTAGRYTLGVPAGTWWLAGVAYVSGPSGQIEISPPQKVVVTPGSFAKTDFTVDVAGS